MTAVEESAWDIAAAIRSCRILSWSGELIACAADGCHDVGVPGLDLETV